MKYLILSFVILIQACATTSGNRQPLGDSYQTYQGDTFQLRPMKQIILSNGLKVIFIKDDSLPLVHLQLRINSGVREEAFRGLNSLTASLIEMGTKNRSAVQIAEELSDIASEIVIQPDSDFTMISANSLSENTDQLVALMSDLVRNPVFAQDEIDKMKSRTISQLKAKKDKPSEIASQFYSQMIYGDHPYGKDSEGTIESIKLITKDQIESHYRNYFSPQSSALVVVGQFSSHFEEKVKLAFGIWEKKNISNKKVFTLKENDQLKLRLVSKKDLKQTQIMIGQLGIQRTSPDYLFVRMANEILGGSFASRLNQHVRDDLGLTYSIYSFSDPAADRGTISISTFTKNETVEKTIDEAMKVVNEFYEKGISEKELNAAKAQMIGQFPRAIETTSGFAFNIAYLDFHQIPVQYLVDFNRVVQSVTVADLNKVIKKYFNPNKNQILIYGDQAVIGDQLKKWKPEIVEIK